MKPVEFEKLTVRQWDAIFASNARGRFSWRREALKWMRRKRGKGQGRAWKRRLSTWDLWVVYDRGQRTRTIARRKRLCTC